MTTPGWVRSRPARVSRWPGGWPGGAVLGSVRPGAAAGRTSRSSPGRPLRPAAWPTPRSTRRRRTGRCAAARGWLGARPRSAPEAGGDPAAGSDPSAAVAGSGGGGGGSRSAPRPGPRRRRARPPGVPVRRSRCRSWCRPRLGVPALGERLQERVQFCLHFHHEAGLGQLLLQSLPLGLQGSDLLVALVAGFTATRRRQRGRRAGVTGPPPRHDVAGVQALTAQQGTLFAVGGGIVGGQDLQLVLRG